jgi:hypothetical protein
MESRGTLYLNPNEDNTDATIEAAKKRAVELGIKYVAVASSSGSTGVKVAEAFARAFNFFDKINGLEFRELVALPRTKKFW